MKALQQARGLPLRVLVRKVASRAAGRVLSWSEARRDARDGTWLGGERVFVPMAWPHVKPSKEEAPLLQALADRFASHTFDLLGSGWVRVAAKEALDVPPGCRAESDRVRALISEAYEPIDWHVDFKSGHRWSERTWHAHVAYGHLPDVDVKVPWELARLQHVPVLVLAARTVDGAQARRWRTEAVDQMLDFVASSPPRFGVNWRTAMDVGIRAANMALALDLLVQDGFEGPWMGVLARSLEEHARHIATYLEWSPNARGNHYLANVAGLAWCARHLEPSPQTDAWLAWCAQELGAETERQFLPDGANFEASVCYHRLSVEMVAWTWACLSGVPDSRLQHADPSLAPLVPPLDRWSLNPLPQVGRRMAGMEAFLRWATKPDGRVAQIGDNDSGRFFRLPGAFDEDMEVPLDAGETIDVLEALSGCEPKTLAGRLVVDVGRGAAAPPPAPMASFGVAVEPPDGGTCARWCFGDGCWDGLETAAFPDFGLFVWRSRRVWMAVRCGPVGQGGLGGHAHNDALHVELQVEGCDWIRDPGTGVYTPDPRMRNAYRSAAAHFVPQIVPGVEPASLAQGLFRLSDCGARCHHFGPEGFVGSHDGFGPRVWRVIDLEPDGVRLRDVWEGGALLPVPKVDSDQPWCPVPFSPGYGRFGS